MINDMRWKDLIDRKRNAHLILSNTIVNHEVHVSPGDTIIPAKGRTGKHEAQNNKFTDICFIKFYNWLVSSDNSIASLLLEYLSLIE